MAITELSWWTRPGPVLGRGGFYSVSERDVFYSAWEPDAYAGQRAQAAKVGDASSIDAECVEVTPVDVPLLGAPPASKEDV